MNTVIVTEHLTKYYGQKRGIIDLSLTVQRGEVFGFLGPNGAGKTTAIRLLLDVIRPTRGRAEVLGMDTQLHSVDLHRRIGYLPGELALYDTLTGRELLSYFAHLRRGVDWGYVDELAERLDLDLSRPIRTLSRGNKQKVGLIQAFMHRPELLILDEPTSGLDPLVQQEFYRLIREVRATGGSVFLSSHIMAEVEQICDRVGIIREGQLVVVDEVKGLKARSLRHIEITFAGPIPSEAFAGLQNIRDLQVQNGLVRCTVAGPVDALIKAAAQFEAVSITSREPDLEEIFLTYYRGEAQHAA